MSGWNTWYILNELTDCVHVLVFYSVASKVRIWPINIFLHLIFLIFRDFDFFLNCIFFRKMLKKLTLNPELPKIYFAIRAGIEKSQINYLLKQKLWILLLIRCEVKDPHCIHCLMSMQHFWSIGVWRSLGLVKGLSVPLFVITTQCRQCKYGEGWNWRDVLLCIEVGRKK